MGPSSSPISPGKKHFTAWASTDRSSTKRYNDVSLRFWARGYDSGVVFHNVYDFLGLLWFSPSVRSVMGRETGARRVVEDRV